MANAIDEIQSQFLRKDIPVFGPGDTVRVHVRIVEQREDVKTKKTVTKERVQPFEKMIGNLKAYNIFSCPGKRIKNYDRNKFFSEFYSLGNNFYCVAYNSVYSFVCIESSFFFYSTMLFLLHIA